MYEERKDVFETANKLDICPSRWIQRNDVIPLDVVIYSVNREKNDSRK